MSYSTHDTLLCLTLCFNKNMQGPTDKSLLVIPTLQKSEEILLAFLSYFSIMIEKQISFSSALKKMAVSEHELATHVQ